jgi:hypothetical protein
MLIHRAKKHGSSQVLAAQSPRGHGVKEIKRGRFPTPLFRRSEVQTRRVREGLKSVGVSVPEGEGIGGTGRQENMESESFGDLIQHLRAVHGLGPGFNGRQFDGACLVVVIQFRPGLADFGIESLKAYAQAGGLSLADAVVLGGRKGGEAVESLFVGFCRR